MNETNKLKNFFVIEGGDGSGKTTQINLLKKRYPGALFTREPGGTVASEAIRELFFEHTRDLDPLAQLNLVYAARIQNVIDNIAPALRDGRAVFCDRYQLSTYAYQLYVNDRLDLMDDFLVTDRRLESLSAKPYYFFLDIQPKDAVHRTYERDEKTNVYDTMKLDFHEKIYQGYQNGIKDIPVSCTIIDATQSIEQIHEDIVTVIEGIGKV